MSLLREANWRPSLLLSGSGLLSLYSGWFCLLWVLVVEIALNSQPVSGSAPHIGLVGCSCPCEYQYNHIPFQKSCRLSAVFLSGYQLRQTMILLAWNCRGLAQAESKRSLKAIVNKVCPDLLFCLKLKLVLIESKGGGFREA